MSRYSIALNKTPQEIQREHLITGFGFDKEIDLPHRRAFFLREKEIARVGIIFDDPDSLFYCAKVHFYKSHRFLCKSTKGHLACCCQPDYPGRQPALRIATILIRYESNEPTSKDVEILPWVFGKTMFEKLKELNDHFPINKTDFLLKCPNQHSYRFKQYEMMSMNSGLLWQELELKSRLLEIHSNIKRTIRNYLGEDYSEEDILKIISQPDDSGRIPGPVSLLDSGNVNQRQLNQIPPDLTSLFNEM